MGFSLSELDDAGIDIEIAERLGLPVDASRVGAYGPNVSSLREFIRVSRQPS
jgi:ribosomal protein L13E